MRIIGTVVLVLIAGMSRSTSARVRIDPTRLWCIENSGPTENFTNCYAPVFDEIKETHNNIVEVNAAIAKYCNTTEILDNCLRSFGESIKLCAAGSDRLVFVDPLINVVTSMLRFPCEHSDLIKDLLNTTDLQCIASKQNTVVSCLHRITTDYNSTIPDHPVSEIDPQELDTGFYNTRRCSNILAAEQCGVRALEECEDKRFSTTFDSLLKYANNNIPCGNLPRLPKTQVSPAQV